MCYKKHVRQFRQDASGRNEDFSCGKYTGDEEQNSSILVRVHMRRMLMLGWYEGGSSFQPHVNQDRTSPQSAGLGGGWCTLRVGCADASQSCEQRGPLLLCVLG